MEKKLNTLCTVCLRGGSKGVPGKNLRPLLGKPLMEYTILQAMESQLLDDIVISTDSEDIASIARKMGLHVWFLRPKHLASDQAAKIPVIIHALHEAEKYYNKKYSIIVDLDATSPLREMSDIDKSMEQFLNADSSNLVTVCKARKNPYFNMIEKRNGQYKIVKEMETPIIRRQDAPEIFEMNASIYIWKRSCLLSNQSIINKDTDCYVMPEDKSLDIDSESDFRYVEYLMKNRL